MANFCVAYGLCPLIDQRSLLGVSDDSMPGCVIVTIGKNIVIRCKFQDQKQISSWSTKDKLTSPVIFDTSASQYVAVFNQNQLRMWMTNEEQLDKVKKYKFQHPIHCIIPQSDGDTPLLLFRNGCVVPLERAVESRKDANYDPVLQPNEVIKDHYLVTSGGRKLVTLLTINDKGEHSFVVVPVVLGEQPCRHTLNWNEKYTIVGCTVVQKDDSCIFLTLWSDGRLFSYSFLPQASDKFPGVLLHTVTAVNTNSPVSLMPLSSSHVAVFGADPSEEGAVMVLLNLQFSLVQSRLHFKLYSIPPRLWIVGANLLLAVGHSLVVVPYRLETEHLSTLVGSHSISPVVTYTKWFDKNADSEDTLEDSAPHMIQDKIKHLRMEGLSQASIIQTLVPLLIDTKQVSALTWCLQKFIDVPESCLAQILVFCLSEHDSPICRTPKLNNSTSKENGLLKVSVDSDSVANILKSDGMCKLIDVVFKSSFNDECLVSHLRTVPFTLTLSLLAYLTFILETQSSVPQVRILEWISVVLDAHYQQYLLSRDPQVLSVLTKLQSHVNSQFSCIEEMKQLVPLIKMLRAGRVPGNQSQFINKRYSIELLHLY